LSVEFLKFDKLLAFVQHLLRASLKTINVILLGEVFCIAIPLAYYQSDGKSKALIFLDPMRSCCEETELIAPS
jgi:hypothetical protein